jgi:phenylacetic acid degradation operon negative regulatory protein
VAIEPMTNALDHGPVQPQDLVITICGSHLRRPGERVWSGGMVELLGEFGFSTDAARAALSRLVTRGLLARVRVGRMVHYTLTPRAQELLADGDRRIFSFGRSAPAADAWTMVWHAVPEDRRVERSRLASQLRFLGFGSVQDATWIAASDREQEVRRLLASLSVEDYASVLVGRLSRGSESALLLSGAWDLDELARVYDAFLRDFGPFAGDGRSPTDREAFVVRTRMLHAFRGFPSLDPELPDAMLGSAKVRRDEVVATFDAVYARLSDQAEAHFTAVARIPPDAGGAV